ncbi:MAG: YceD family protein [Bdellovibrionota bacterium]
MNQGKLTLREVGSQSIDRSFTEKDEWVLEALKAAAPHEDLCGKTPEDWAAGSQLKGDLRAERLDPEYSVSGHFEAKVPLLCPRCGVEGLAKRDGNFRLFLKPLGPREEAEEGDDPDYIFLETPYIDLVQILSEQIVAVEPVVEYLDLELSGAEHACSVLEEELQEESLGDEFHLSSGQNEGKAGNSPFAALGKLKDLLKDSSLETKASKKTK